jgi:tetratricopeptide (TPR) repeat protein
MKKITKCLTKVALQVAEAKADEIEVRQGLPINRDEYVKNEALAVKDEMLAGYKQLQSQMRNTSIFLQEELQKLPVVEKNRLEEELKEAVSVLSGGDTEGVLQKESLQAFLSLSNPTLLWMYQLARECFEEEKHQEAQDIFFLLVLLNPMVRDYWMALGFAYEARCLYDNALEAFSFASLLDPEHAPSRYQSASVYLLQGEFEDALAELEVLDEIIDKQNLTFLRPQYELLLNKARNKSSQQGGSYE